MLLCALHDVISLKRSIFTQLKINMNNPSPWCKTRRAVFIGKNLGLKRHSRHYTSKTAERLEVKDSIRSGTLAICFVFEYSQMNQHVSCLPFSIYKKSSWRDAWRSCKECESASSSSELTYILGNVFFTKEWKECRENPYSWWNMISKQKRKICGEFFKSTRDSNKAWYFFFFRTRLSRGYFQ